MKGEARGRTRVSAAGRDAGGVDLLEGVEALAVRAGTVRYSASALGMHSRGRREGSARVHQVHGRGREVGEVRRGRGRGRAGRGELVKVQARFATSCGAEKGRVRRGDEARTRRRKMSEGDQGEGRKGQHALVCEGLIERSAHLCCAGSEGVRVGRGAATSFCSVADVRAQGRLDRARDLESCAGIDRCSCATRPLLDSSQLDPGSLALVSLSTSTCDSPGLPSPRPRRLVPLALLPPSLDPIPHHAPRRAPAPLLG